MKRMLGLTAFLFTISCQTSPKNVENSMASFSKEVPGITIRLIDQDQTIKKSDMGVRSLGQSSAITSDDKWHIGSCTKTMTSYLIAQLVLIRN